MTTTDRYLALGERWRTVQTRLFDVRLAPAEREQVEAELGAIEAERARLLAEPARPS